MRFLLLVFFKLGASTECKTSENIPQNAQYILLQQLTTVHIVHDEISRGKSQFNLSFKIHLSCCYAQQETILNHVRNRQNTLLEVFVHHSNLLAIFMASFRQKFKAPQNPER